MARITVEDCISRIPNHFNLTLAAAYRARQLANGSMPLVPDIRTHTPTLPALPDLAAGQLGEESLSRSK